MTNSDVKNRYKKEFLYFAYCFISNYIAAHGHYFFLLYKRLIKD